MNIIYDKTLTFAKEKLKVDKVVGLDHALRVLKGCEFLGQGEKVDIDVLRVAALLHDISIPTSGRKGHHEESARIAEAFLRENEYPKEKIASVGHIIRAHSRYEGPEPKTKEAKILYDADRLDFIGAIGIVRGIIRGFSDKFGGEYTGDVAEAPTLFEGMKEMAGRKVYTIGAKKIAKGRLEFIDEFITWLRNELEFKN